MSFQSETSYKHINTKFNFSILSSVYIRKTIMNKKEEEKSKEDEKTKEEDKMASETVNTVTKVEASSDEEEKKLMS